MTDSERIESYQKIIDKAAAELGEHFDNVIIFANSYQGKEAGTFGWKSAEGNVYAVKAQALEWASQPFQNSDTSDDDEGDQ